MTDTSKVDDALGQGAQQVQYDGQMVINRPVNDLLIARTALRGQGLQFRQVVISED